MNRHFTKELRDRVTEAAGRLEVPGVVIGVYRGGLEEYVYEGVTSLANPLPVCEATLFQIGSTGKTVTATALMVLVERGAVDLAAPVRLYVPDLQLQDEHVAEQVTVQQLLNHTSGWAGDFLPDTGYGDDALERYVQRLPEAVQEHPLGARVSYSNSAFIVAGHLIEKVTKQTFEAAIQELVFDPIGLIEHYYFAWQIMTRRFAAGHKRVGDSLTVTDWEHSRNGHPAGTELSASARDQIRYARFHLGHLEGLLREETLIRMQSPTTSSGSDGQKGISWHLEELDGTRIVSHGGSTSGHQSAFVLIPSNDFGLVIQTNARHGLELITELQDWILESQFGLTKPQDELLDLGPEELLLYTGTYESHTGTLTVMIEGNRLIGTLAVNPELMSDHEQEQLPFNILSDNQFLIIEGQYKGVRGGIERDAEGRVSALNLGRIFTRRE